MTDGGKRGPKALTARDWIFGSRPRRLILSFVLTAEPPAGGWSLTEIADAVRVDRHGGATGHVKGLLVLGLLVADGNRYRPGDREAPLAKQLLSVLGELERVPEARLDAVLADL
jgi:hypothetical protein